MAGATTTWAPRAAALEASEKDRRTITSLMALAVAEAEVEGEVGWAALAPGTAIEKAPAMATLGTSTDLPAAPNSAPVVSSETVANALSALDSAATSARDSAASSETFANALSALDSAATSARDSAASSETVANALSAALFGTASASGAVTGASYEPAAAHEHLLLWLETISLTPPFTPPGSDQGSDGGFMEDAFSDANDALSEAAVRRHSAAYSAAYRYGEGSGDTEDEGGGEGCSEGGCGEGKVVDDEHWSLPNLGKLVDDEHWSLPQLLSQSEGFAARGARSLRSSKELFLPLHAHSRSSEGWRASSRASSEPDPWAQEEAEYDPNLETHDPNLEAYDPWAGDVGSSSGSRQRSTVSSSQRGSRRLDTGPLSARHSARSGGSTARSSGEISSGEISSSEISSSEISVLSTYSSVSSSISLGRVGGAHSHPFGISDDL